MGCTAMLLPVLDLLLPVVMKLSATFLALLGLLASPSSAQCPDYTEYAQARRLNFLFQVLVLTFNLGASR
jgi:hypothetical protein